VPVSSFHLTRAFELLDVRWFDLTLLLRPFRCHARLNCLFCLLGLVSLRVIVSLVVSVDALQDFPNSVTPTIPPAFGPAHPFTTIRTPITNSFPGVLVDYLGNVYANDVYSYTPDPLFPF